MNNSDLIALAAIFLNLITLGIVIFQTKLSKNSFDISNSSFQKDKQIRELEILPKMHFVIHVQLRLEEWKEKVQNIKEQLEIAVENQNHQALKEISSLGRITPKGLVVRFMYEECPDWLSEVYITGAKYYYYVAAPLKDVWDEKENKGRMFLCEKNNEYSDSIIERCDESIYYLNQLLKYIEDAIPSVFLNSPESLADSKFLTEE